MGLPTVFDWQVSSGFYDQIRQLRPIYWRNQLWSCNRPLHQRFYTKTARTAIKHSSSTYRLISRLYMSQKIGIFPLKQIILPGPGEVWGPSEVVEAAEESVWGSLWLCWLSLLEASKLPVDFFGTSSFSCSV